MDLASWEEPTPASIRHPDPDNDDDWRQVAERYTSDFDLPLRRCLDIARGHGARTVVVETRYIDAHYRSEYSAYYSRIFASVPDSTHRLHFFSRHLEQADMSRLPANPGYLGYIIIRPSPTGPVARAMLRPPAEMATAVRTAVTERIHFFGQRLDVSGAPFTQQDASLGACAHSAAWMCHYTAYLRGDVGRRVTADFAIHSDPSLAPDRPLPTTGLTVAQLSDLFRRFDMPALFYRVGDLPSPNLPWQPPDPKPVGEQLPGRWDHRVIPVICRHVTSGFPVLVGTHDHAFVIIGWYRSERRPGYIHLIRHDDQVGPYLVVDNVLDDSPTDPAYGSHQYTAWRTLHVPMPGKLWLTPEAAERDAGEKLRTLSAGVAARLAQRSTVVESLDQLISGNHLALRTYAQKSNDYKRGLEERGYPERIISEYRLARFPRYVWVVEAVDRRRRAQGLPPVLGEAVYDATSSEYSPSMLAFRIHGVTWMTQTDGSVRGPIILDPHPVDVGGNGPA
jgi:hypothetical protein